MTITQNEHGYYEVRVKSSDGRIKSFSTHKKSRAEAERVIKEAKLRELEEAAELGILTQNVVAVLIGGKRTTVDEAIDPWIAAMRLNHKSENYINNCAMWVRTWIRDMSLEKRQITSVTESDIEPWVNSTDRLQSKAGTRRLMLSAVKALMTFASYKGWVQGNPAMLVSIDYSQLLHNQKETLKRECFTDTEVAILMRRTAQDGLKPSRFWNAAVPISRCLGLRLGDICGMEWDSVSDDRKSLTVWTVKRDKRVQPAVLQSAWLEAALAGLERTHKQYLFPIERSIMLDVSARSLLSKQFSRLCQSLAIYGKTFHCLRASYITERAEAGDRIEDIAIDVGHSNAETTKGYVRS